MANVRFCEFFAGIAFRSAARLQSAQTKGRSDAAVVDWFRMAFVALLALFIRVRRILLDLWYEQ